MYEHKKQPLAPKKVYYRRILMNLGTAALVLIMSLLIGVIGSWKLAGQSFIDALHNASMILSGMGPVFEHPQLISNGGKIFSSIYALFSGVIFITNIGFIMARLSVASFINCILKKINSELPGISYSANKNFRPQPRF